MRKTAVPKPRFAADAKRFNRRLLALGFRYDEIAILLDRNPTMVNFYIKGQRRVTPEIWEKLATIEKTPNDKLCRSIVQGLRRKKKTKPK